MLHSTVSIIIIIVRFWLAVYACMCVRVFVFCIEKMMEKPIRRMVTKYYRQFAIAQNVNENVRVIEFQPHFHECPRYIYVSVTYVHNTHKCARTASANFVHKV